MSKKGTEQEEENVKDIPYGNVFFSCAWRSYGSNGSDFAVSGATE